MEYFDKNHIWGIEWNDTSRRIDSAGRVSIPSKLKNALKIECGDTVDFGLLYFLNGEKKESLAPPDPNFIIVCKNSGVDVKYRIAADVLKELGVDLPERLVTHLGN